MIRTLNELLDDSISRASNRTALVLAGKGRDRRLTYGELSKLVLQAAAAFRSRGVAAGDRIAIVHRNGLGFVVAYFALARLGAVAVPINFMVHKPAELAYMLSHCSAKGVVTEREFLQGLLSAKAALKSLENVWLTDRSCDPLPAGIEDFWPFIDGHAPLADTDGVAPVAPEDMASILYTSGTMGQPKGVMLTHANLVSNCETSIQAMRLTNKDSILCLLPMFHTFGWTVCVLIPLRLGSKIVCIHSITPATPWLKAMGRYRVTLFVALPQIYSLLAKQATGLKRFLLRYWFFRKVRLCISGAAPLSNRTAEEFRRALHRDILEGYGLTETSPVVTINRPGSSRAGSVGPSLDKVELRIIDEAEKPLPAGGEGEICVRGPNVMKGYLDDPEATAQAFTKDGWLKTGDVGALDADGYLYIRDRKKDMIIVKGLKVFSAQVESVLASHPAVAEAAVIGIPKESGEETIRAFIVLKEGAAASKAELLQFSREKLDPYKRPRDLEIVQELPKNALQKVLKRVLRQRELEKIGRKPDSHV